MLRVLWALCHPLHQSPFMSGGAKRSSLNQRFHEIKIDSFLDIWIDGWIYLSIQISFAISPKSLIWPGNKALLWAQEAKGMSSAASPPHFFISPCPFRMRFARHWRFALLFRSLSREWLFSCTGKWVPENNTMGLGVISSLYPEE